MKSAKQKKTIQSSALFHLFFFVLTLFEISFFIVLFRNVRSLFGSGTGNVDSIGYAQYFGYSTYFDSLYMLVLVALPCVNYLFLARFFHEKK